jgi:Domain of unknown function (DUF4387)
MTTAKLSSLAKVVRSKNAGVDKITFDIIFADRATYERTLRSGAITKTSVARLYGIPEARISDFVAFDPGCAIKFTVYRSRPSGSPGDPDIFGAQQYAPLLDVDVPLD